MRLIDADQLERLCNIMKKDKISALSEGVWDQFRTIVEWSPTIDPIKHGKWINRIESGNIPTKECSECHNKYVAVFEHGSLCYCPRCGAKMEGQNESD